MDINPPKVRAMEVPPSKPILSFPTPNYEDLILTEFVDSQAGSYQPLSYGTGFDNVRHTSYTISHPNHVLVYQAPMGTSDKWVTRIWASNRIAQDTYNYSIKFAEEDPDYPTYVRVYVVPRSGYTPLPALTPDPDHMTALLTHEELINETDPPELNSIYVKVVRVYETLPGPVVQSIDYDTELNILVYTDRQVVLSSSTPSPTNLTLELRESPRSKYTKLRVTSYLQALPASKTEYQTGRYPFPALVYSITVQKLAIADDANGDPRSEVRWYPSMRSSPNVPAIFKVITTFFTTSPAPTAVYAIAANNLVYSGISFQISIQNVLNDSLSPSVSFTGDGKYNNLSEGVTFSASTPSATDYTALIGTYQTVASNISRWRGQIWVQQDQQVLLI